MSESILCARAWFFYWQGKTCDLRSMLLAHWFSSWGVNLSFSQMRGDISFGKGYGSKDVNTITRFSRISTNYGVWVSLPRWHDLPIIAKPANRAAWLETFNLSYYLTNRFKYLIMNCSYSSMKDLANSRKAHRTVQHEITSSPKWWEKIDMAGFAHLG